MKKLWTVFLGVVLAGCATTAPAQPVDNQPNDYLNVGLTRYKGQRAKHFASRVTVRSSFVKTPEFVVARGSALPPGLTLDRHSGVIQGVPTQAGIWNVQLGVRDRYNGTRTRPVSDPGDYYHVYDFELKIFDQLTGES